MKIDSTLQEIEVVKNRFSDNASDVAQFGRDMDSWIESHPHSGPVVRSAEELQAHMRHREATEARLPDVAPYRVHDPIIAEIRRTREQIYRERQESSCLLREEPKKKQ